MSKLDRSSNSLSSRLITKVYGINGAEEIRNANTAMTVNSTFRVEFNLSFLNGYKAITTPRIALKLKIVKYERFSLFGAIEDVIFSAPKK